MPPVVLLDHDSDARDASGAQGDVFAPAFDDGSWGSAVEVTGGPWAATPPDVETVGATIGPLVTPYSVVAAGTLGRRPGPARVGER